ncbi:MAG: DivIVA domain-containing protein [Oscillibacter sp.]|jgi:cell division initiation protein|nr:DivIVA domain-containing protein [Oscillibacter sp.]
MLTPQEVSARSFTKTMMGGYNMTMVDEFLDELTDDYTSLYKENASLKAKMKVLVEKVEEYRATEDSMRATLLTAQRMADSLVKEAEEKRDGILKQAEAAAREKLDGYRREAEQYHKRLQQGQEEIRRFVAESRALCEKELQFLEEFPSRPLEEEPEAAAAESIGERILSAGEPAPAGAVPEAAPQEAPQAAAQEEVLPPQTPPPASQDPVPAAEKLLDTLASAEQETEDLSATRRVNINDLKFGPNYRSEPD